MKCSKPLLWLSLALMSGTLWAQAPSDSQPQIEARQLLVMLPLAPAHFRPDADYSGA